MSQLSGLFQQHIGPNARIRCATYESAIRDLIVRRQYTYEEEEAGDGSSTYPSTSPREDPGAKGSGSHPRYCTARSRMYTNGT